MSDKAKITINGKEILATPGAPLLQTAIDAGIEVPHFCYHPGLGVDGNCRLCLVEVAGMPKLATSCTVPVKEGMVVSTNSASVQKARKGVLEFFLLNHPLDCPFCDKGGECPLQNYTYDSGQFSSRFEFQKTHKAKHQVIGDHIVLDKERCVLCSRCVRFGRNFAGHEELQIGQRGARSEIFIPEGTQLTSGFTGNLADICPVGALTTREFRFRARPWEMKTVNTVCGECSLGCNVQAWRKETELLRLTPRIAPDVNEWWLCDRGRFSIHAIPNGARLKAPIHAANGSDLITAEKTVSSLADGLRRIPRGSLAVVADPSLTNEEFLQLKLLAKAAGDGRVFVPVSDEAVEFRKKAAAAGREAAFPAVLEQAKTALILGENIEEDHPVLALRLRRLFHTRQLRIVTAHSGEGAFKDAGGKHMEVSEDQIPSFFQKTAAQAADENTHVFLSDRWITPSTASAAGKWLEQTAAKVSVLFTGANARGMADQWDETVHPFGSLETEIQRGKVQGLLWFGAMPEGAVFDEYVRNMRFFAHAVARADEAHPSAGWILPLDLFTEKEGTYTNTFGAVQTLRKAKRTVAKGFSPSEILPTLLVSLGGAGTADVRQLYGEVARQVEGYPKTMAEIPETTKTYHHYERAVWR